MLTQATRSSSCVEDRMAQAEAARSRKIMEALRAEGWFCFKVHGSEFMMTGLPDVIVCAEGLFIGLETKLPDKRANVSARQRLVHEQINAAGGVAVVAVSPREAIAVVKQAIRNAQ